MSYNGVFRTALATTSLLKSTYIPSFSLNNAQQNQNIQFLEIKIYTWYQIWNILLEKLGQGP